MVNIVFFLSFFLSVFINYFLLLAASVATREFMRQIPDKETYYPYLLPRM